MIKDLDWDCCHQMNRLANLYKILHNLIEMDTGNFTKFAPEQRTRGTHNFKYICYRTFEQGFP